MNVNLAELINKFDIVSKLLCDKRNANVIFKGNCYFITTTKDKQWKPVAGLLPVLKECFWKDFDPTKIIPYSSGGNGSGGNRISHGKGKFYGSIRGTVIHEQIHDYILFDMPNFLKKYSKVHEWTDKIMKAIRSNGWKPIISEFDVYDASIQMATSIDIVCVEKDTGKIICIELKTGYKGYFDKRDNNNPLMSGCLRRIPLTIKNCASVQLATSMLFLIKHHKITNIEGWVIHINDDEFTMNLVKNEFIMTFGNKIYKKIYSTRRAIIKERQLNMKKMKNKSSVNNKKPKPKPKTYRMK